MDHFKAGMHKGVGPGGLKCPCCRPKATKKQRIRQARKAANRDTQKEMQ